ncbi:MAG TPA: preprotein translocase subunit YajC [Saprospiraceae bacterium]|nr:preprotein translocase subunit YajC [Saprospiraceae bacterium]
MNLLSVLLQAQAPNPFVSMWPLLLILVVFYFFIIRPQSKRQKEQTAFLTNLQKGDEIVTASGILGQINKIEDEIITLEIAGKTYIRITKNSVSKELTEAIYGKKS